MKRTVVKVLVVCLVLVGVGAAVGVAQNRPDSVVVLRGHQFNPASVTVSPGTIVVWENTEFSIHNVESDVPGFGPDSDGVFPLGFGRGWHYWWRVPVYTRPGTVIYYHCRFHGRRSDGTQYGTGMVGRIVVE